MSDGTREPRVGDVWEEGGYQWKVTDVTCGAVRMDRIDDPRDWGWMTLRTFYETRADARLVTEGERR